MNDTTSDLYVYTAEELDDSKARFDAAGRGRMVILIGASPNPEIQKLKMHRPDRVSLVHRDSEAGRAFAEHMVGPTCKRLPFGTPKPPRDRNGSMFSLQWDDITQQYMLFNRGGFVGLVSPDKLSELAR